MPPPGGVIPDTMLRRLILLLLCAIFAHANEPLTLERVLDEVRVRNPDIGAAQARAAARRERATQAAAWEDPVVGLELQRADTRLFNYDTLELQLTQKLPLSGNLARRRALASAEAAAAEATVQTRRAQRVNEARAAFFQLLRVREQLQLLRGTERLLGQATEVMQSRAASGSADTISLLAAETERATLQREIIALERDEATAVAALNVARDLPADTPVGELAEPELRAPFASFEAARAAALEHRPELREAEATITAAARNVEVAARAGRPDPEVMVKAHRLNGGNRVLEDYSTGVAISVPWFNRAKYRAAEREALRTREAAELDAAALRTRTAGEVRDAWEAMNAQQRTIAVYQDKLLPLARSAVEAARAGLVTGRNTVGELIAAEKSLRDAQTQVSIARAAYERAIVVLQTLTGTDLP